MILYLDSSCLVKAYFEEVGTDLVKLAIEKADVLAASMVAEAEVRATMARKKREGLISAQEHLAMKKAFAKDWTGFFRLKLSEEISGKAGDLAEKHGLRGFDAIHLASCMDMVKDLGRGEARFYCADMKLNVAASKEGFKDLFPSPL